MNKLVKLFVLLLLLAGLGLWGGEALANTCTAESGSQNWAASSSWSNCGSKVPQDGDTVVIPNGSTITLNTDSQNIASLTVAVGGVLQETGKNLDLQGPGNLTNNGTISWGRGDIKLDGNFVNTGTFTAGTGLVEFSGNAVQTITGNVSFYDLKVDNGSSKGLTLIGNVVVNGSLSGNAVSGGLVKLSDTCPNDYTLTSNSGATVQHSCPGGGGGGTCGALPSVLTNGSTLGLAQTGFKLNTNSGTTKVVNNTVTPVITVLATGSRNALSTSSAPTVTVTATLPALSPATFPSIAGTNGAKTNNTSVTVAPGSYTSITVTGGTTSFSGGATPTYIRNLTSTVTSATLKFAPGDYYIDSLTVGGSLTISSAGLVRLFIGTQQTAAYGDSANTGGDNNNGFQVNAQINTGGDPANLQLLLYPLVTYFEFNNGVQFTGIMYQPSIQTGAPKPSWGQAPGEFDLHTGVNITGSLYTPGIIETWGSNVFNYTPAVAAAVAGFSTCPVTSNVDHFAVSHSGTGVNCQAEPVTVTAHKASHAVLTTYTGTISLSTTTGKGDWSKISGGGTLTAGAANSGSATYTFVAGDAGQTVLGLKDTLVENVSLGVTNGTATLMTGTGSAATSEHLLIAFANAGFSITDASGNPIPIGNQVAGQTSSQFYLQAVKTAPNGACTGVFNTTVAIEMASMCNNPVACAGKQVTVNTTQLNGGTGNGVIAATGLAGVNVSLVFGANSIAPFTVNYPDVGQITLAARYNIPLGGGSPSGNYMLGSSNPFVVKPGGFVLSAIVPTLNPTGRCAVNPNSTPACALDAGGAKFVKAGEAFNVTATATTVGGAATPNFGKETAPEGVTLTSTLVAPAGGNNPGLGGAFGAFSNGVATADGVTFLPDGVTRSTPFAWNEVGIITLTPALTSGNYLGSGAAAITGTTSGNVGRFYAAKFALINGAIGNRADLGITGSITTGTAALTLASAAGFKVGNAIKVAGAGAAGATFSSTVAAVSTDGLNVTLAANALSTVANSPVYAGVFTYIGEPMSAMFTLTAKAVDGTTTLQNYTAANNFAKLSPTATVSVGTGGPLGVGAVDSAVTRTPFTPCGVPSVHPCLTPAPATGTFVAGVANINAPFTIYRDTVTPRGPYALLDIGVAPKDSDDAILATYDLDTVNIVAGTANHALVGRTQARFGQLKMQNMYGSEQLPLDVPIQAQYYDVTSGTFKLNTDDASTLLSVPPPKTMATPDGSVGRFYSTDSKNKLAAPSPVPDFYTVAAAPVVTSHLVGGKANLHFSQPTVTGWLDIILDVPDYLKYNWGNCNGQTATADPNDDNPCARATFGIYKSPLIYRRENY